MGIVETDAYAGEGAVAPRVSLESMEDKVLCRMFVRGDNFFEASTYEGELTDKQREQLGVMTVCMVVTENGFTIVDTSAPASVENYVREKGERFSYEGCLRKMWQLEGYLLREKLSKGEGE